MRSPSWRATPSGTSRGGSPPPDCSRWRCGRSFEAAWGRRNVEQGHKRTRKRLVSVAEAVPYLAIGISAVSTAAESKSSNSDSSEKSLTAKLMGTPPGRILIVIIGILVIVVAYAW